MSDLQIRKNKLNVAQMAIATCLKFDRREKLWFYKSHSYNVMFFKTWSKAIQLQNRFSSE